MNPTQSDQIRVVVNGEGQLIMDWIRAEDIMKDQNLKACADTSCGVRKRRSAAGLQQARKLVWGKTTEEMLRVYERAFVERNR